MVAAGEESQDAMESKTEAASVYGNASIRTIRANRFHHPSSVDLQSVHTKAAGMQELSRYRESAGRFETITLYLSAARSTPLIDEILKAKPRRIIFNPGAENEDLAKAASARGIDIVYGCTLAMVGSGTF